MRTVLKKSTRLKGPGSIKFYASIGLYVLCIAMLLVVPFFRPDSSSFIGEDAFFNLRMANSLSFEDPLSYGGRFAAYSMGLPAVLSLMPDVLAKVLPVVLGFLSFVLFGLILNQFEVKEKKISMLLLAISPPFIYLFTTLNSYFVPVFLSLLAFYFFNKKNKMLISLSIAIFMLLPFFNIALTFITALLLFFFVIFKKKSRKKYGLIAIAFMILTSLLYYGYIALNAGTLPNAFFNIEKIGLNYRLMSIFSDLGGKFGLATFAVLLSIFGFINVWDKKYKNLAIFFSVITLTILVFLKKESIFMLNLFMAVFAAKGLHYLYHKTWQNDLLKNLTIIVLVCGLIFSSVSFTNELVKAEPTPGIMQGLEFLERLDPGVVFSHPSRGIWINYAGKTNVMDTNFAFAPQVAIRWVDTQKLFYMRDINKANRIFDKYNIKYVWIDSGFRDEIWSHDEEGLQFILEYTSEIEKIYDQGGVQIWEINFEK